MKAIAVGALVSVVAAGAFLVVSVSRHSAKMEELRAESRSVDYARASLEQANGNAFRDEMRELREKRELEARELREDIDRVRLEVAGRKDRISKSLSEYSKSLQNESALCAGLKDQYRLNADGGIQAQIEDSEAVLKKLKKQISAAESEMRMAVLDEDNLGVILSGFEGLVRTGSDLSGFRRSWESGYGKKPD